MLAMQKANIAEHHGIFQGSMNTPNYHQRSSSREEALMLNSSRESEDRRKEHHR
jgi:hypothetical protein